MKKEIKNIGNSIGLTFSPEERRIYELEVGKIIDIEICVESEELNNETK